MKKRYIIVKENVMGTSIRLKNGIYHIEIPVKEAIGNHDFKKMEETASKSKATDEQIKELSDTVTADYWSKNKDKLLNGTGD